MSRLTRAKAATSDGSAGQPQGRRGSRSKNIENNPMQSSLAVAGLRDLATTFDTSGKSPAIFYDRADDVRGPIVGFTKNARVVLTKVRTHNHMAFVEAKAVNDHARSERPRRMGPGLRRDDGEGVAE